MLKIGELASYSGVSVETLRYYERQGLLPAPQRADNGYRLYPASNVGRVAFILRAKTVGFTLDEIRELLSLEGERDTHTCAEVKRFAEAKRRDIEQRMHELQLMHDTLSQLTQTCCGGPYSAAHCSILTAFAEGETRPETTHDHVD
ncbi:Zn(2+)-responsive transcriptional regulator [Phytohalomonas tamaricis]|uniref:Zn(2+)-responsive transcriptional regulator n=1 Tax=Phytohalomonas tamaricis TaxID=2081032 RepID=UPI000D0B883E|nr:Zn(2+)-responsive transcriptional regulator [Phytohalomonas tamaricis]